MTQEELENSLGTWPTIILDYIRVGAQLDDRARFLAFLCTSTRSSSMSPIIRIQIFFVDIVPSNVAFVNQDRIFPTRQDR